MSKKSKVEKKERKASIVLNATNALGGVWDIESTLALLESIEHPSPDYTFSMFWARFPITDNIGQSRVIGSTCRISDHGKGVLVWPNR